MSGEKLCAPVFPQMANDGVINRADALTSGSMVEVAQYASAQQTLLNYGWKVTSSARHGRPMSL